MYDPTYHYYIADADGCPWRRKHDTIECLNAPTGDFKRVRGVTVFELEVSCTAASARDAETSGAEWLARIKGGANVHGN